MQTYEIIDTLWVHTFEYAKNFQNLVLELTEKNPECWKTIVKINDITKEMETRGKVWYTTIYDLESACLAIYIESIIQENK